MKIFSNKNRTWPLEIFLRFEEILAKNKAFLGELKSFEEEIRSWGDLRRPGNPVADDKEIKKAKGVSKDVNDSTRHKEYVNALFGRGLMRCVSLFSCQTTYQNVLCLVL